MLPLLSNRVCLNLGPHHQNPWLSVKVDTAKIEGASLPWVLLLVVVAHIPAACGSQCPWPELDYLPATSPTGPSITIEKWTPKTLTLEGGGAVHPCLRSRIWQCIQSSIWLQ